MPWNNLRRQNDECQFSMMVGRTFLKEEAEGEEEAVRGAGWRDQRGNL